MSAPAITTCACNSETESRCEQGARLWSELAEAVEEVLAIEASGSRIGHKPALDEFAARRGAYQAHKRGES